VEEIAVETDDLMKGSELSFQEIYDIFRPKILRYLTRLVNKHDAEDLTQEVFVKVSQGLKEFRGESKLSSWIYRIATNTALDKLRSRSFQQNQEMLSIDSDGGEENKYIRFRGSMPSIDQQLIRKEMNECIRNVIKKLPEDYRTVVVLGEMEELKNHEIAEILQVSVDTVKIRLHRARAKLRKELENHCSFYRDERNVLSCDLKSAIKQFKESD
jgi:RNA polymerase sigma-70 factor (ECF subfamily)